MDYIFWFLSVMLEWSLLHGDIRLFLFLIEYLYFHLAWKSFEVSFFGLYLLVVHWIMLVVLSFNYKVLKIMILI